jgi:hypothetical protein
VKKLILMFFVVLFALGLVACTEDEPSYSNGYGVSYGLVHGHYVGVAKVVVDADDVVVNVQFDEYYLPYNTAQVTLTDAEKLAIPADVVKVVTTRTTNNVRTVSESFYSKYVSVNGVLFTIAVSGNIPTVENTEPSQTFIFSASGIANIETWVETEANAKAYVEAVEAGLVFNCNASGVANAYPKGNASAKLGNTKSATGYWTNPASYPLGWGGNMLAITEALVGTKMGAVEADLVKATTAPLVWSIGTIVTGATLSDFVDYYMLAQVAYNNALATKA